MEYKTYYQLSVYLIVIGDKGEKLMSFSYINSYTSYSKAKREMQKLKNSPTVVEVLLSKWYRLENGIDVIDEDFNCELWRR